MDTLNQTRGDKVYMQSTSIYVGMHTRLGVRCEKGHTWDATPSNLLHGTQGCRKCSGKMKKTHDEFVEELRIHRPTITVCVDQHYTTSQTKLKVKCEHNHTWQVRPISLLLGSGCPQCNTRFYSKKGVEWLTTIMQQQNIVIQHAENGGEYAIPGTLFKVDGYCESTNTVYEFHGDMYHGNPAIFESSVRCNPYNLNQTAKELYERTMWRERLLCSMGYNLVRIWESEYDELVGTDS
jgi:hypothetical protein